jgi:hypothetical protein
MKKVFIKPPILAFRRDKNLEDILVHKKHNSMFLKQEHKCEPCSRNCAICPYEINLSQCLQNKAQTTFAVIQLI